MSDGPLTAADRAGALDLSIPTPAAVESLKTARTMDEVDAALRTITRSVAPLCAPDISGHKLFMPALDKAVVDLPRRLGLADVPANAKGNDNVVVIATEFYNVGGHTRVAADLMRLNGRDRCTLIFTDIYAPKRYSGGLKAHVQAVDLPCRSHLILKSGTLIDRIFELYNMLAAIRPTRIVLFNHHLDVCAVAAAYPFRDLVEFVHHVDYEPCLGATVPFARHVDVTLRAHRCCCAAGLDPVYASMTVPDLAQEIPVRPRGGEPLTLGTAGHPTKYLADGETPWADWVVAALKGNERRFVHIGPLSDALREAVTPALEAAGIDPARYVMVGPTNSVREELVLRNIDVYVGSAPKGGGLSTYEALSAGIPVVLPVDPGRPPLLGVVSPIPGWREVYSPDQLASQIDRVGELRDEIDGPEFQAALKTEFSRFARYAQGEPLPPTPTVAAPIRPVRPAAAPPPAVAG